MKVAITAQADSATGALDPRFGRAAGFMVFDTANGTSSYHDNSQNLNLAQGAGIQAAQNVANTGAQVVITGHVGPKAFRALEAGSIKVYLSSARTVAEALDLYKCGSLECASEADKDGHW